MKKLLLFILLITFLPAICWGKVYQVKIESQPELHQAAFYGNFDQVQQLVNTVIVDVDARGQYDFTALMWAVMGNNRQIIQYLVESGADINATGIAGYTAFHFSVTSGSIHMYGGAINYIIPRYDQEVSTVELLLRLGADVNAKTKEGYIALMLAKYGNKEIVKLLLDAGAEINAQDNYGATALLKAAWRGADKAVKVLLDAGADLDTRGFFGMTALMFAAEEGHTEIVKMLLDAGADMEVKNNDGFTALMIARKNRQREIVQLLMKAKRK